MITETGSIKTEFIPCERAARQYNRVLLIVSIICLALGSAGICAYLSVDILSVFNITNEPPLWILIIVAVPFAFGLIFVTGLRRAFKAVRKSTDAGVMNCEFFADHFVFVSAAAGQEGTPTVVQYSQIVKRKETKDYLFATADMVNIITVDKRTVSGGELNALRGAFGLTVGDGERVTLPSGNGEKLNEVAERSNVDETEDEKKD